MSSICVRRRELALLIHIDLLGTVISLTHLDLMLEEASLVNPDSHKSLRF